MLNNINFVSTNEITFSNILNYKQNVNISKEDNIFYNLIHMCICIHIKYYK